MDVTAFSPEYACGIMASLRGGRNLKYLDIANEKLPQDLCAANRFAVGLVLSRDTVIPDVMVYAAANPCDTVITVYSNLHHYCNIPCFYLDIPYLSDERGCKYVANELKKMVSFIEEQTKQKLDLDRLREVIGYSNQAKEYILKLDNLRKNAPCPTSSRALYITGGAIMGLSGVPEFADWCKDRYDSAREQVQRGKGAIPEEKIRLVWIATGVDFNLSIFDWLENEYGAVTVASLLNMYPTEPIDNTGDESKMFEGLAMRELNYPMARHGRGSADYYISDCINVARDYKADAVIFASNTGCKWNWATAQLVKDTIYDELGIPTLCFELCPMDPRVLSFEGVKAKFEQFFELVL
jgi:benzoyl-CoA reductase/2-hydroxyglutaryl-CoA dehydratase subunit BcrC/BadD/HgdB